MAQKKNNTLTVAQQKYQTKQVISLLLIKLFDYLFLNQSQKKICCFIRTSFILKASELSNI